MTEVLYTTFAAATPHFSSVGDIFDQWWKRVPCAVSTERPQNEKMLFRQLVSGALSPLLAQVDNHQKCGFVLASAKGNMGELQEWLDAAGGFIDSAAAAAGPPTLAACASAVAAEVGLSGPVYAISTACSSGLSGLIEAIFMVQSGFLDEVLILAVDIAGGFVQDGFAALKAVSAGVCRPFDQDRDGLVPGSAAAGCLLQRDAIFKSRPRPAPACRVCGWGASMDAVHLTAPDREAAGLVRAIEMALSTGGLSAVQIDCIMAHGTGTKFNDAMEAAAIKKIFAASPAITGSKGIVGHTLGASGLLEAALAAEIFDRGIIPPLGGLIRPEWPDLDFVMSARHFSPPIRILKTSSGFGGINAAVVLESLP